MNKLDNLTAENYQCPAGEEGVYHVVIEMKQFNPKTGERMSVPSLQKFDKKIYEDVVNPSLIKQGYSLRVVHDPVVYAQNKAKVDAMLKVQAEKRAAAEAEREAEEAQKKAKEEKERMKREIMAELRASGVLVETKKAASKEAK